MFDGAFSIWHLLIVAGIFVLLFGAKRLPDAARSLGKSARILKTELKDLHDDDDKTPAATAQLHASTVAPPAPVVVPAPVVTPAPSTVAPAGVAVDASGQPVGTVNHTPAS